MATLLSNIAQYCIDENPEISLKDFHDNESMPSIGYCSNAVMSVLREGAIRSELSVMAQCMVDAVQDDDLSRALQYAQFAQIHTENLRVSLEQLFVAVLAHEIKKLLTV